jgi:LCP family protein required for cell wall assembly
MLIVFSFSAAAVLAFWNQFDHVASKLGSDPEIRATRGELTKTPALKAQTFVLIGADRRYNEVGRGRSDTTILVRADPKRKAIAMMSIPRDLAIDLPGEGKVKFNAAYNLGGPRMTVRAIKRLTGLKINHVIRVDFFGFAQAVNALGCILVDVDRRYYHSNAGLAPSEQYAEINLKPGYQRLCGRQALQFVRFRHEDNDILRNARQQTFLRELRSTLSTSKLVSKRSELLKIVGDHTRSDIDSPKRLFAALRLGLALRHAEIRQIPFPAEVTGSTTYLYAPPQALHDAVRLFLRAGEKAPADDQIVDAPGAPPKPSLLGNRDRTSLLVAEDGTIGSVARQIAAGQRFPTLYPTRIYARSDYVDHNDYAILHAHGGQSEQAYRFVFKMPDQRNYWGVQGTSWTNPPILDHPDRTKRSGRRRLLIFSDGKRIRLVGFKTPYGSYWVSNSLARTLSNRAMLAIARGLRVPR